MLTIAGKLFITMASYEHHVVSNHRQINSLCNSLFRLTANSHYWSIVSGIQRWPVDSPHIGPIVRKEFPGYDEIMDSALSMVLVQDYSISSALAMEILQSCTKASKTLRHVSSRALFYNQGGPFILSGTDIVNKCWKTICFRFIFIANVIHQSLLPQKSSQIKHEKIAYNLTDDTL